MNHAILPLLLSFIGGCVFQPELGEGALKCGPERQCPPNYACASDDRCHSSDLVGPDGGVPDLGDVDIDPSLPALDISNASVTEGSSGATMMTFTVTLAAPSDQTVAVDFATADGDALSMSSDYFTMAGNLALLPGETTGTISVVVLGDALHEADETFVVNLMNAVNARIRVGQGVGTIVDDDPVPAFTISDVSLLEGDVGTSVAMFDVLLSEASGVQASVKLDTADGSATAGSDYAATSVTLFYPPGTTKQTAMVPVQGDITDEGLETFLVNLSAPTGATIADAQATGSVLNDDSPLPSLTIANASQAEGDTGTSNATFTITLNPTCAQTVTVNYATVASFGSATAGVDYAAMSGQLTFLPGTPTQTISIPVFGDTLSEADETFAIDLSSAVNANILVQRGLGTIPNDDPLPGLSISDVTVVEGKNQTTDAVFTVSLSAESGQLVTVAFTTTPGTATAGSDFVSTTGTVMLGPGTTSATITVKVKGDMILEPDETFTVDLSAPTHATLVDAQGTGTIENDD